ncbi:hypothetical protein QCD79_07170 [Pseudomonas quasicaspiana]|nr:hypothetical protein [Pseudomonas quasicaspiana]
MSVGLAVQGNSVVRGAVMASPSLMSMEKAEAIDSFNVMLVETMSPLLKESLRGAENNPTMNAANKDVVSGAGVVALKHVGDQSSHIYDVEMMTSEEEMAKYFSLLELHFAELDGLPVARECSDFEKQWLSKSAAEREEEILKMSNAICCFRG